MEYSIPCIVFVDGVTLKIVCLKNRYLKVVWRDLIGMITVYKLSTSRGLVFATTLSSTLDEFTYTPHVKVKWQLREKKFPFIWCRLLFIVTKFIITFDKGLLHTNIASLGGMDIRIDYLNLLGKQWHSQWNWFKRIWSVNMECSLVKIWCGNE